MSPTKLGPLCLWCGAAATLLCDCAASVHDAAPLFTRRELIERTISDLALDFMVYRRKEDEDLPRGEIEAAIAAGEITVDEIAAEFAKHVRAAL